MKRVYVLIGLSLLLIGSIKVNATSLSGFLPGGKNYIDYNNVFVYSNFFELEDSIKIKPDTDYTLSFPGYDILRGDLVVSVFGSEVYLDGNVNSILDCVLDDNFSYCNFHSSSNEDLIYIELENQDLDQFYDVYGVEYIQLEEGLVRTDYEEYIEPVIDTEDPLFDGTGLFINSYSTPIPLSAIIDSHITAYDEIDGDMSSSIVVEYDEYTGYEGVVGDYTVNLSVTDNALNKATFELIISIKDEIDPIVSGPSSVDYNFSELKTVFEIINSDFSMTDEIDSELSIELIEDGYSLNEGIVGNYNVTFRVVDDSFNYVDTSFIVNIVDEVSPILNSSKIYNSYLSNSLSFQNIIDALEYSDDYDSFENIGLNVISDGYTLNQDVVGTYFIVVELVDSSVNKTTETLTINVIDDIAPVISGPETLSISYESNLTITDLKAMLSVIDNYDLLSLDDLELISDTFTNRGLGLGNFEVTFKLVDSGLNDVYHTIDILVIDDVKPVIYVDSYIVTINLGSSFNENDAIQLLRNNYEIDNDDYEITTLVNEYEGNELTVGSYIYKIRLTSSNGDQTEKEFIVKVVDVNEKFNIFSDLSIRNISIYSFIVVFSIFVIVRKRK